MSPGGEIWDCPTDRWRTPSTRVAIWRRHFGSLVPGIILAPYWEDSHPDHVVACRLVEDARFWSKLSRTDFAGEPFLPPKLYHYFSVHLRIHPSPSMVLDISDQIETKLDSILAYESQVSVGRQDQFPTFLDDVRDRARYWGWTIGAAYAEPLVSREEIGLTSLTSLR